MLRVKGQLTLMVLLAPVLIKEYCMLVFWQKMFVHRKPVMQEDGSDRRGKRCDRNLADVGENWILRKIKYLAKQNIVGSNKVRFPVVICVYLIFDNKN